MKKYYSTKIASFAFCLSLLLCVVQIANVASAQTDPAMDMGDAGVAPSNPAPAVVRPPLKAPLPGQKDRNDLILKEKARIGAELGKERQDMRLNNQGIRDDLKANVGAQKDLIRADRDQMKNASGTPDKAALRGDIKAQREKIKEMRKDALLKVQANISATFTHYITILNGGYTKLQEIINKKSPTLKNIDASKALLADARVAIDKAAADVSAFKNWKPATDKAAATDAVKDAATQVDLNTPRNLASQARKSIELAHQALRKVAISLGLGGEKGENTQASGQPNDKKLPAPGSKPAGIAPTRITPVQPVQQPAAQPVEAETETVQ